MKRVATILILAAALSGPLAAAETSSVRISGTVDKLDGRILSVKSKDGQS